MDTVYYTVGTVWVVITIAVRVWTWNEKRRRKNALLEIEDLVVKAERAKACHFEKPTAETGPAIRKFAVKLIDATTRELGGELVQRVESLASVLKDRRVRGVSKQQAAVMDEITRIRKSM